jgi:hypothetical protein
VTSELKISPSLSLPLQAVTETFAILAVKRAGKSNAAVVMAEEMYDAGVPWVAIDPKGDWWGVRAAGDGQAPGLSVLVFGGLHGDVPLEPTAGRLVADLVAEERVTCVLDVSEMTKADQRRFLTDFADRLYRRNTEPLHVFCEEADEYIPQRVMGEAAKLVGAFETLVKRGGFRGIGVTLITQRSASLNKDVLTQAGTLIAMRTPSPQDRKAVLAWIDYHAASRDVIDELPQLDAGEAWVFSPQWLRTLTKIRFRRRRTFDSGATPTVGGKPKPPARLADVDLAAIKEAMAETIERAKADDPKELRKQIAELQRHRCPEPVEPQTVEVSVFDDNTRAVFDDIVVALDNIEREVSVWRGIVEHALNEAEQKLPAGAKEGSAPARGGTSTETPAAPRTVPVQAGTPPVKRQPARPQPGINGPVDAPVSNPQWRILEALAWYESVGLTASKVQLAFFSGATSKSSAYANNLGALRSAGYVDYPRQGVVALTDAGRALAPSPSGPTTSEQLQDSICDKLPGPQQRIVRALAAIAPMSLTKEEVAVTVEASPTSSAFANNLGALRSLGLIDYPERGQVAATDALFLERGNR